MLSQSHNGNPRIGQDPMQSMELKSKENRFFGRSSRLVRDHRHGLADHCETFGLIQNEVFLEVLTSEDSYLIEFVCLSLSLPTTAAGRVRRVDFYLQVGCQHQILR